MSEIIVADEIIKLENALNFLKELQRQLERWEMSEKQVLTEIDFDDDVRQQFLVEFMEIVRDELRSSRLADFLDGYGNFGIVYDLCELLDKVVRSLEFRLENLRRGLEWQS